MLNYYFFLVTCFNQEDCTVVSPDLICRHDTLDLSNEFQYTGRGPYCLCYDNNRIDENSGLCTSKVFVFKEPEHSRDGKI